MEEKKEKRVLRIELDDDVKKLSITGKNGDEQTYNRVKAYIYKGVNAYERVMENIGHLIAAGIEVVIRMNLDMHNADNLERLR
jgi:MoaA/NifB/PqqE/SkfB family radical SAM enzyme